MKKWNRPRRNALRLTARLGLLALLVSSLPACESDSVFEGEPTVAPPLTAFDRTTSADRAIHGGILPISVTASDPYVGIDSIVVRYSGAMSGAFTRRYATPPSQVRIDTVFQVPFGTQGEVVFEAFALNRYESTAEIDTLLVQIARTDTIRPKTLSQQLTVPPRMELQDTVRVRVSATDDQFGSGIARVGVIVSDLAAGGASQTYPLTLTAPSGSANAEIAIPVSQLPGPNTARQRQLTFVAFAVDQAGNCSAIGAASTIVGCAGATGQPVNAGLVGTAATTEVTRTRTFRNVVSSPALIGDLVVDPSRGLVYASNQQNNSVDRIRWTGTGALTREGRTLVGALPRGMTLNRTGDTLIVANSGGTNLSYVYLGNNAEARRYETPNATLWQLTPGPDSTVVVEHIELSDRPQFVAQDSTGMLVYSTSETVVGNQFSGSSSIRTVEFDRTWSQLEANVLLWTQVVSGNAWGPGVPPAPCYDELLVNVNPCVVAFVDSVRIHYESPFLGTQLRVYDHVQGSPSQIISVTSPSWYEIVTNLRAQGSDIFMYAGSWSFGDWLHGDPTFVTASGDGSWVNVADGKASPGRMWMWGAVRAHPASPPWFNRWISDGVNIEDFINNTNDPITAVSANQDGLMYTSRSAGAVYFVTNPMRLRGSYSAADISGGVGLALHPDASFDGGSGQTNWAAAGGANSDIILIDTRNFRRIGRIGLMEPLAGPLRVARRQGGDPADVIAHLFGVTQSGSVFEVTVRSSDINP
jgi:hypothetical protein